MSDQTPAGIDPEKLKAAFGGDVEAVKARDELRKQFAEDILTFASDEIMLKTDMQPAEVAISLCIAAARLIVRSSGSDQDIAQMVMMGTKVLQLAAQDEYHKRMTALSVAAGASEIAANENLGE